MQNLLAKKLKEKKEAQGKTGSSLAAKIAANRVKTEDQQDHINKDSKDPNKVVLLNIKDIESLVANGEIMHNRSAMSVKDQQELKNFAESLKITKEGTLYNTGLLQAITVRKTSTKGNTYELIAGFRRTEAFKLNGDTQIPAIIIECDDKTARRLRNAENKQRRAVNAYDEIYGELEEIQLYCDFNSLHEAELKIKNIKKVTDERAKIAKTFSGDLDKKEEYIISKSKYPKAVHSEATQLQEAIFEITQKQLNTFVNKLDILKINDLIKNQMLQNSISYTEAQHLKKVLKNDEEKIQEALEYLFEKNSIGQRPSAQAFEKYLKDTYLYKEVNRGEISKLSNAKKSFSLVTDKAIDKLDESSKDNANALIDEINTLLDKLNQLCTK